MIPFNSLNKHLVSPYNLYKALTLVNVMLQVGEGTVETLNYAAGG